MESLASLYVTLVLVVNSLFPSINLPHVLGVDLTSPSVLAEESSAESVVNIDTTSTGEARTNIRQVVRAQGTSLEDARRAREEALVRMREAKEAAMEEAKTAREEFKERLRLIQDERKRQVVERIDTNMARFNEKWVEHWNKVLSRLREILAKIDSRVDKLAEAGKDVSDVKSAIAKAETAIDAAQAAINEQAGKTYVIEIGEEETLGENVSSVVKQFRDDIKGIIEKVKIARMAVRDAFLALKEVLGEKVPSPTP